MGATAIAGKIGSTWKVSFESGELIKLTKTDKSKPTWFKLAGIPG
jgi:hypothetical protein